jgi:uncharacterized protein (DUF2235 family)
VDTPIQVGLLQPGNFQQVPFAYAMYTRDDTTGWNQSNAFKHTFSLSVNIHFLGVWCVSNSCAYPILVPLSFNAVLRLLQIQRDTVNSVGIIGRYLPFTASNTVVHTFRHAVSLDEHRAKFQPNLWNFPSAYELSLAVDKQKRELRPGMHMESNDEKADADMKEVWFAGCHGGVFPFPIVHILRQLR